MKGKIVVESFQANQHPRECMTFIQEHTRVLQVFDLANITSAKPDWAFSPSCVIVTVRDQETNSMIAGGRIQIADGKMRLPIEDAVSEFDSKIHDVIHRDMIDGGTSEICGLWSTRKAARMGLGSIFIMRSLLAISYQLEIKSIYTLCAPSTVKFVKKLGGELVTEIGDNGTFYYPKLDLIATAIKMPDNNNMSFTDPVEKSIIEQLRLNLSGEVVEEHRGNQVEVKYLLNIH